MFWSAGGSLLRAEDFSCTLDVLGSLGIGKRLQFFISKFRFFSSCKILPTFCHQTLGPDPHWTKVLDPDMNQQFEANAYPQVTSLL